MSTKETVATWLRFAIEDYKKKKRRATTDAERHKAEGAIEALEELFGRVQGQL